MKKNLRFLKKLTPMLALAVMMMAPMWGWGQTEFTYTFSEQGFTNAQVLGSGSINEDLNYSAAKNSSSNDPAYYSSGTNARFYFSSNGDGGSYTITTLNDVVITGLEIYGVSSYLPTVKYNVDGQSDVTASLSVKTYTISGIQATTSLKFRNANTTSLQLRITGFKVYYTTSGSSTVSTPTFNPAGGNYLTTQNVVISTTTENATIYYTTDGSDPDNTKTEYAAPILVNANTTLKAIAYADGYDPSGIATAVYSFPIEVADIASLRAGATDGTIYQLTGEAVLTYQTSVRNAKYIQDATGAILIDDNAGAISTSYNLYDGITGITGTLASYNGMLQFTPVADPGAATSTGNSITPLEISLAGLTTDHQAMLVKVLNTSITETGNFAASTNYTLTDDSKDTGVLRTAYSDLDYIGTPIPEFPQDITGVVLQFNTDLQLVPRSTTDFVTTPVPWPVTFYVDMSNAPAFTTLEVVGDFNGWAAGDVMTLVSDNFYTFTTTAIFNVDEVVIFKFRTDGTTWEQEPNRTYTVVAGTNEYHAVWNVMVPAEITYANIQWPATGEIEVGGDFDVYARVYANGLTGEQGDVPNLQAWIGYSSTDTDPATWTTWISASFNTDVGNNEEYMANIGASIPEPGVYYYASRFKLGLDEYVYGGYSVSDGGFWDGIANVSGELTINASEPSAHATGFEATANSSSAITVMWTDSDASGYLIKGSEGSFEAITAPDDGVPEDDGLLVKNIASGVGTFQFTGLTPNTPYYFRIFPYNGTAASINYKTDGTIPQDMATTAVAPEVLAGWDFNGLTGYGPSPFDPTTSNSNVTIGGLSRGSGVETSGTAASNAWGGTTWGTATSSEAITSNKFITFTVEPNAGYLLSFSEVSAYNIRRSGSGPTKGLWQYQINGGAFTDIGTEITWGTSTSSSGNNQVLIDLTSISALQNITSGTVVTFRIVNYEASGTGTWYLNDPTGTVGDDFIISGSISLASSSNYTNTGNWSEAGNWSNGIPDEFTDAIINGNVTVDDLVDCNNMTISPLGTVTVGAGQGLIVHGNLLIESDATGTGSFIGAASDYTITGTQTIQRYVTGGSIGAGKFRYHLLSIPLDANIEAGDVFTGTYLWHFVPNQPDIESWTGITSLTENLDYHKGFLSYVETADNTFSFTGNMNTGSFSTAAETISAGKYKLIPNPYPSAIDWDLVTKTDIENAVYFYNSLTGNYVSYLDGSIPDGQKDIPVGQAVFVKAKNADPTITFDNSVRVHSNQSFYKNATQTYKDVLKIAVSANNSADATFIRFRELADNNYNGFDDASKLRGFAGSPQLYTQSTDAKALSINTLATSQETVIVPLAYELEVAGEAVLSFEYLETFEPTVTIFLEDLLLNKMINLREESTYSFEHAVENDPLRFKIHFMGVTNVNEMASSNENFNIWTSDKQLYILANTAVDGDLQIDLFDLSGRLLQTVSQPMQTPNSISLPDYEGIIMVRVRNNSFVQTQKVFIR